MTSPPPNPALTNVGLMTAFRAFMDARPWEKLKPCHTLEMRMPWWDSDNRRLFEYVQVLGGDHAHYTPGMFDTLDYLSTPYSWAMDE